MLYSKAPITEATIDIQFEETEIVSLKHLKAFQAVLGDDYPDHNGIQFNQFVVQPSENATEHRSREIGYRFANSDKRRIVQARMDGFSFTLLAPYERWETFSAEAKRQWHAFRTHVRPSSITRLAVRYINRIDVPLPTIELSDYLATVPQIADGIPQVLQQYFMQLVLPMGASCATAVINQALVPPPLPDTTSIMLDIELFRDTRVPQDEDGIWQAFELLRIGKNQIFNATITERTRGLIN